MYPVTDSIAAVTPRRRPRRKEHPVRPISMGSHGEKKCLGRGLSVRVNWGPHDGKEEVAPCGRSMAAR